MFLFVLLTCIPGTRESRKSKCVFSVCDIACRGLLLLRGVILPVETNSSMMHVWSINACMVPGMMGATYARRLNQHTWYSMEKNELWCVRRVVPALRERFSGKTPQNLFLTLTPTPTPTLTPNLGRPVWTLSRKSPAFIFLLCRPYIMRTIFLL